MSLGKTLPELPTKVEKPNSSTHERSSEGPNFVRNGDKKEARSRYRERNKSKSSARVRFNPPFPATRNFRKTAGFPSNTSTFIPWVIKYSAAINPAGPPPITATV